MYLLFAAVKIGVVRLGFAGQRFQSASQIDQMLTRRNRGQADAAERFGCVFAHGEQDGVGGCDFLAEAGKRLGCRFAKQRQVRQAGHQRLDQFIADLRHFSGNFFHGLFPRPVFRQLQAELVREALYGAYGFYVERFANSLQLADCLAHETVQIAVDIRIKLKCIGPALVTAKRAAALAKLLPAVAGKPGGVEHPLNTAGVGADKPVVTEQAVVLAVQLGKNVLLLFEIALGAVVVKPAALLPLEPGVNGSENCGNPSRRPDSRAAGVGHHGGRPAHHAGCGWWPHGGGSRQPCCLPHAGQRKAAGCVGDAARHARPCRLHARDNAEPIAD